MTTAGAARPRFLPARAFPSYAYLPGRQPHPVRDPAGHSYQAEMRVPATGGIESKSELVYWGIDLFNHGYYWEAHEVWEDLWREAELGSPLRLTFKGLILLAAAGVKIREGKSAAAAKHAGRAAALLRSVEHQPDEFLARALGIPVDKLAAEAGKIGVNAPFAPTSAQVRPVFTFVLGPVARSQPG
jgi:Domain of unknown function (DUF309)